MGPLAFILATAAICLGAVALSICHGVQPAPTNRPAAAAAASCRLLPGCCGRVHHQSRDRGQPRILGVMLNPCHRGRLEATATRPSLATNPRHAHIKQTPQEAVRPQPNRSIEGRSGKRQQLHRLINRGAQSHRYHTRWLHDRPLNKLLAGGRSRPAFEIEGGRRPRPCP